MSGPLCFERKWFEDEETVPGGGRIRYVVEAEAPDEAIGEKTYRVIVNEEEVREGVVEGRDSMLLDEADLLRMIAALQGAQEAITGHRALRSRNGGGAP